MTEKEDFAKKLEEFVTELKEHISTDDGQWTVKGFIDILATNLRRDKSGVQALPVRKQSLHSAWHSLLRCPALS